MERQGIANLSWLIPKYLLGGRDVDLFWLLEECKKVVKPLFEKHGVEIPEKLSTDD